jgi:hypothetical protein
VEAEEKPKKKIPIRWDFTCKNKGKTYPQMVRAVALATGYSKPEAMFMFDTMCAIIHFELANERPVHLPGVCTLVPKEITNQYRRDIYRGGHHVSPTWIHTRVKVDKELVAAYRKNHPFYPCGEDRKPIYPDLDDLI